MKISLPARRLGDKCQLAELIAQSLLLLHIDDAYKVFKNKEDGVI